jgi:transposase
VGDDIFRSLVIARLSFPSSKRATVEYLKSYFDEDYGLHKIYRYLDSLNDTKREEIQAISVRHTMEVYGGKIGVLFYDVTTLYFDSDKPDKLRKPGFSKDGKHSNPQIVLGLLVSGDGCPLAYAIH